MSPLAVTTCPYARIQAGEACSEWKTWSQYLGIHSLLASSLLQSIIYIGLSVSALYLCVRCILNSRQVALAASSAVLVVIYAPQYAYYTPQWCIRSHASQRIPYRK